MPIDVNSFGGVIGGAVGELPRGLGASYEGAVTRLMRAPEDAGGAPAISWRYDHSLAGEAAARAPRRCSTVIRRDGVCVGLRSRADWIGGRRSHSCERCCQMCVSRAEIATFESRLLALCTCSRSEGGTA